MTGDFTAKLSRLIGHWQSQGLKLNAGNSKDNIRLLETDLGFCLAEDFRDYLMKVDGFADTEWDADMFSFWSLATIRKENGTGYHPEELIWFSDYLINLCCFGCHKTDQKIYAKYQTTGGLLLIADSFAGFTDLYLEDAFLLLR